MLAFTGGMFYDVHQINSKENQNYTLMIDNDELTKKVASLEAQAEPLEKVRAEVTKLETEKTTLETDIKNLTESTELIKEIQRIQNINESNQETIQELCKLESSINALKSINVSYDQRNSELKKEIDKHRNNISQEKFLAMASNAYIEIFMKEKNSIREHLKKFDNQTLIQTFGNDNKDTLLNQIFDDYLLIITAANKEICIGEKTELSKDSSYTKFINLIRLKPIE